MFICTFDPFGRGKPVYEFKNRTDENPPMPLNDGTTKYFFNCTYEGADIPEELIHFYEFVRTGTAEDALTKDLKKAVEENRMSMIYRSEYLTQRLLLEDAKDEGIEEGIEKGIKKQSVITEQERKRADAEKERADALEKEVARLKELLGQ